MTVPGWPEGTAVVLSTTGPDGRPHAIPVSTAMPAGEHAVVLALGPRRASLANLERDPRVALTVLAGQDRAFTLHGSATVVERDLVGTVAVRVDVHEAQDHHQPTFTIEAAVAWRWTDDEAAGRDEAVRAALRALP